MSGVKCFYKKSQLIFVFSFLMGTLALSNPVQAGCIDDSQTCLPASETNNGDVVTRQFELDFQTTNQDMNGPGESTTYQSSTMTIVDPSDATFARSYNAGSISDFCLDDYINDYFGDTVAAIFRSVFSNPCYSYGARMESALSSNFGVDMRFSVGTGQINLDYPIQVDIHYPTNDSFRPGDWVTISEQFQVMSDQAGLSALPPEGAVDFTVSGHLDTNGWGKGCIDDCSSRTLWDVNQSRSVGGSVVSGAAGTQVHFSRDVWPIGTDNVLGFMAGATGYISIPMIDQFDSNVNGRVLSGTGSDQFVDLSVDLGTWFFRLTGAPRLMSAAVGGGNITLERARLGYKVFSSDVDIVSTMYQKFDFEPVFHKFIQFSHPVNWQVTENGLVVQSDTSNTVTLDEGQSLKIQLNQSNPVQVDTHVYQSNHITKSNWVNNQSDLDVEALDFTFVTPSATIFNRRCAAGVCLPRLGWDSTNINPGPAIDESNIAPVDYDYTFSPDSSWELGGFQNFQLAPYTLDPNQPPQLAQIFGTAYPAFGETVDIDLMAGFIDPDGNPLSISIDHLPIGFSISAANHLIGTITGDFQDNVKVTATDLLGDSVTQTLTIDARMALVDVNDGVVLPESGLPDQFQIRLNRMPNSPVIATLAGIPEVDFGNGYGQPFVINFDSNDWNIPFTVVATAANDWVDEVDQVRSININLSQQGGTFDGKIGDLAEILIPDDDQAGYISTPNEGLVTTEDGGSAILTIQLTSEPTQDVTLHLTSSESFEGIPSPSSVTFTSQNWNLPQQITVTGQDDNPPQADGANHYLLVNTSTSSVDPFYNGLLMNNIPLTNMDNDTAEVIFSRISGLTTQENGSEDRFTVRLSTAPILPPPSGLNDPNKISVIPYVYVHLTSTNLAEVALDPQILSKTTSGSPQTITVAFDPSNFDTPQEFILTGLDDSIDDGDQLVLIHTDISVLDEGSYNNMTDADLPELQVTNINDDFAGLVLSTSQFTVDESGSSSVVNVSLNVMPVDDVTVTVNIADSTEISVDQPSLIFTPANWNTPQSLTFSGVDDLIVDETVLSTVSLQSSSADLAYNTLPDTIIATSTLDDDVPSITVSPLSGMVTSESGTQTSFSVVLDRQPIADVIIPVQSATPDEVAVAISQLVFTPANWDQPQNVTVSGVDDLVDDNDQPWTIQLSQTISYSGIWSGVDATDPSGTNTDNDTFGVVVSDTSSLSVNEDGSTASFSIQLSSQPTAPVSFPLLSSQPGLGAVSPTTLTITPQDWNIPHAVSILAVDNDRVEPVQTFAVQIMASVSADNSYNGIDLPDPQVSRGDNDHAGISVFPSSPVLLNEAGSQQVFFIKLDSEPAQAVTIPLSSSDTTEASIDHNSLTFDAGNWNQAQQVTIASVDDNLVDKEQSFQILTAAASSADSNYANMDAIDIDGSTEDDEEAVILVTPNTPLTVGEDGTTAVFSITLNNQPTGPVQVGISSSVPSEVTVDQELITLDSSNWNSPHTITVHGEDDDFDDDNQLATLSIGPASTNLNAGFASSEVVYLDITNVDDDVAGVGVAPITDLLTSEAGGVARVKVQLNAQPLSDVTINLTSSDSSEGEALPATLIFTHENWNLAQEFTITGQDDSDEDGDVDYQVIIDTVITQDPRYSGIDPADVSITNTDDDLDTDDDGVPDDIEQGNDRDQDGIIDSEDYDPTGYFYDTDSGEIVTGGRIDVSCDTGTVEFVNNQDGEQGYYQYVVNNPGTPSVCTQSVVLPFGYELDELCPDSGLFEVPDGPLPVILGSDEFANTGTLASSMCADNIWYSQLSFEAGDAFVFSNNIPLIHVAAALPIPVLSIQWMLLLGFLLIVMAYFSLSKRQPV